ncbi:MAG: hypothetical protein IIA19_01040 [Thaumarchaeota archaeon]|nr:hypothetical protein [Nitrososphaerota archaeon]
MNCQFIVFSIIVSLLIIIPAAYAQVFEEQSKQRSIEVLINSLGEVHVKHVVDGLGFPNQIDLIEGKIVNLTVKDQEGNKIQHSMIGNNDGLIIFPSKEDVIVEYDLLDELTLKDNIWTMDFIYLKSTSFLFPDVDLIFVNEKPVYLGEKKGIMCHGCQMLLEYSLNEPKLYENVKIQDNEYLIEIRTWAKINQFNFDPGLGEISFELKGENAFVTTIIPIDFLSEPYQVFLDGEKILFHNYINNGTHVWLNMRPQNSGDISITGTVITDFGEIEIPAEDKFPVEYVIVSIIIGIVVIGVFFFKRKKVRV